MKKRFAAIASCLILLTPVANSNAGAHGHTKWDRLAHCESTHNWRANTGNGYYGGVQFSLRSWRWVGGKGYPHTKTREQQIRRAKILRERQGGYNAWPNCWGYAIGG